MKINWVVADSLATDPTVDIEKLKTIGPIWGGWRTWRSCSTDNVICHNINDARPLVAKQFHTRCNLYLPQASFAELDRPEKVNLYQGEFHLDVDHPDEIVAMHLASTKADIVLLLGFDLGTKPNLTDRLAKHNWHVYKNYVRQLIVASPDVQWVLLDCNTKIEKDFEEIPNLLFDKLENVLTQFAK